MRSECLLWFIILNAPLDSSVYGVRHISEKDPTSNFTYRLISVGDTQIGNLRDDDTSKINPIADKEIQRGNGNVTSNTRSVYFWISCFIKIILNVWFVMIAYNCTVTMHAYWIDEYWSIVTRAALHFGRFLQWPKQQATSLTSRHVGLPNSTGFRDHRSQKDEVVLWPISHHLLLFFFSRDLFKNTLNKYSIYRSRKTLRQKL